MWYNFSFTIMKKVFVFTLQQSQYFKETRNHQKAIFSQRIA